MQAGVDVADDSAAVRLGGSDRIVHVGLDVHAENRPGLRSARIPTGGQPLSVRRPWPEVGTARIRPRSRPRRPGHP